MTKILQNAVLFPSVHHCLHLSAPRPQCFLPATQDQVTSCPLSCPSGAPVSALCPVAWGSQRVEDPRTRLLPFALSRRVALAPWSPPSKHGSGTSQTPCSTGIRFWWKMWLKGRGLPTWTVAETGQRSPSLMQLRPGISFHWLNVSSKEPCRAV